MFRLPRTPPPGPAWNRRDPLTGREWRRWKIADSLRATEEYERTIERLSGRPKG